MPGINQLMPGLRESPAPNHPLADHATLILSSAPSNATGMRGCYATRSSAATRKSRTTSETGSTS